MALKVVELFAGVGGFRIGLEGYPKPATAAYDVVWSNQWEPSTKTQHANQIYKARWPKANHCEHNIETVIENDFESIPDHDLLVGGFPCQDYSVATTLSNSKGLKGKKGVLWWSIEAILRKKGASRPKYLMLENVDRLLKSPAGQRGRDFAIMLKSLDDLGYAVEWRVINAADYGMPQKRRRVFILGYHKSTALYQQMESIAQLRDWITHSGLFAEVFPVQSTNVTLNIGYNALGSDLTQISAEFNANGTQSPFLNAGCMLNGQFHTLKTMPSYKGPYRTLGDVLEDLDQVPSEFLVNPDTIQGPKGWKYLKGAKKINRTKPNGLSYQYTEGRMPFPDTLDTASRTIITGEGGASPSRFKHVVYQNGQYRRLLPLELERLNTFPDHHTKLDGITNPKRAFFMGNALVVAIVEQLGAQLAHRISQHQETLIS